MKRSSARIVDESNAAFNEPSAQTVNADEVVFKNDVAIRSDEKMSRRRLRNPCWKAEYYLKEAQDVISRSYHELQSLGLIDNSKSRAASNNFEGAPFQFTNASQTSIRRRKSAVELSSRRLPDSSVGDKTKSMSNSGTAVSLFAINAFEENPYPRRKRFTHRQKRNVVSHSSRERLSKSARILNRCYTSSTSTSDDNEALSDRRRLFYKKTHECRRQNDSDESSSSMSAASENSYPSHLYESPKISNTSVSQRAFTSKGPAARRAHRRAAARINSDSGRLQRNQSISHTRFHNSNDVSVRRAFSVRDLNGEVFDFSKQHSVTRWTSQILAEIDSLGCSNVNLNHSTMTESVQTEIEHNDNDSSLINPHSHREALAVSSMLMTTCSEQHGTDTTEGATGTASSGQFHSDTKRRSIGVQSGVPQSMFSEQTGSSSSLDESEQEVVETLKHRSSSSKGVECTSHFEIVAEPSSRNMQKTAAVVSRMPIKVPQNSPHKLTSLLSRNGHFLSSQGFKQERGPTTCSFSEKRTPNHFLLNTNSRGEGHTEKPTRVEKASPVLQPVMRLSTSADENYVSDEVLHCSRRHRTTDSNKPKTPMHNKTSTSSTQWQSLDSCLLAGNERSRENESTCALTKWKRKAEQREVGEGRYALEDTSRNIHNRLSVRGVVASLIRTAEATQFQTLLDSSSAILKNTDPTSTLSLKSAATQTSSCCLSRSSSFDWMDEPSDLIDFESLGSRPEPLGTPFQPESECSTAASNDTLSEYSTERRDLSDRSTNVDALSRTLEESIRRLERAEMQKTLRNNERAQMQVIQDKKTRANEDLDRSIAMLLEYADELKSLSDLHIGRKFLSDTRLNAIQQRIRKDGVEDRSLEQCASSSTLNRAAFDPLITKPLSNEEEAIECCRWLRDAGFPQYAQLYQDGCFPIDIDSARNDHEFLDADSLRALFRRLNALNRCATTKEERVLLRKHFNSCNEHLTGSNVDMDLSTNNYEEEEDQVAISSRWKYHRKSRTWSRIVDVADELKSEVGVCRAHEEFIPQRRNETMAFPLQTTPAAPGDLVDHTAVQQINTTPVNSEAKSPSSGLLVQRSHSERIKERAKAFIKRMDIRLSGRRRRTREAVWRERKVAEEPVIGEPVLISHFSASPRVMRMLPDGIATDMSPRCAPFLVDSARIRLQGGRLNNADGGVRSPVRSSRMAEMNSRRQGMVLLSPTTESSSGDDSPRRHYEGIWSKRIRGVSCEPRLIRHTMEQERNARIDRRIYDRVASDDAIVPKGKLSTKSHLVATNFERRNQYTPKELSILPVSYKSTGVPTPVYRGGVRTESTAVFPRHANRSVVSDDSTPLTSRLSPVRVPILDDRRMNCYDSVRSPVKMVDAACETHPQSHSIVCNVSDRCQLIVNSDGYYEHISDVGSNSSGSIVTSQTSPSTVLPSLCSHRSPASPNPSSSKNSFHNVHSIKVNVGLQCEPVVQGCSRWFVAHSGASQRFQSNLKSTGNEVGTNHDNTTVTQRRDSGVGASLSRSPSDSTTQRQCRSVLVRSVTSRSNVSTQEVRCDTMCASSSSINGASSEQYGTFIDDVDVPHCVDALSVREILRLRKLAFLKLSVLMERYASSGIRCGDATRRGNNAILRNWALQKLLKRVRTADVKFTQGEASIFGMPLCTVRSRCGLSLPRSILELMHFLRTNVVDTVGIFRKNGVRSRIAELRAKCDVNPYEEVFPDSKGLDPLQVHDIADLLKQYFRELPEPLMTMEYSEVFTNIYLYFPSELRLEALRYAVLLLPDENREALQTLLFFLHDIGERSTANNMTARNLAVCFAPSLFHLSASRLNRINAARRHKTIGAAGMPTEREVRESVAAQECLMQMIEECTKLFIPPLNQDFEVASVSNGNESETPCLKETGIFDEGSYKTYLMKKATELLKENRDRWKGWVVEGIVGGVEISSKSSLDGHPLRYFRVWVDVEAPPKQLLMRLLRERNVWDPYTVKWRIVASLSNENCDVFQYVMNDTPAHPTRDVLVVRLWRTDITEIRGGCVLVERSVRSRETQLLGGVSAAVLASRFLIEPRTGRSRVTYISRIDLRGRSNVWYGKVYGGMVARQLSLLRDSFRQMGSKGEGPETKV